jgi:peptidoglycan/xylan/chitin deacetylase (PgdA/CDA1 family)
VSVDSEGAGPPQASRTRRLVLGGLRAAGFMGLWRHRHRSSVTILMLHGVMDEEDRPSWRPLRDRVSRRTLARYLETLARHYRFVSLSEAAEMVAGLRAPRPRCLVLTFDDGYRNNLTHALPVLRRFSAPMALFLPTGKVERRSLFAFDRLDYALQGIPGPELTLEVAGLHQVLTLRPRGALVASFSKLRNLLKERLGADLEYAPVVEAIVTECERRAGRSLESIKETDDWSALLSWDDVASLARDPDVELGSHSVEHTRLAFAEPGTVCRELRESKAEIERRTSGPCAHLAYPNGSWSPAVAQLVREEGYVCALTTEEGLNPVGHELTALRRIGVPPDVGSTELLAYVSGLSEALAAVKARAFARSRPATPAVLAAPGKP